jgi:orotidine-5'-phosphate decarboxylase
VTPEKLFAAIQAKRSLLCVGLDTDPRKIPVHLQGLADPVFEFNKRIVEATSEFAIAYKPNIAFYEAQGPKGWESLQKTLEIIPRDCLTIADAKRGDIGNTSEMYARTFFELMDFDALTVAPYMGSDSVKPFLQFEGKWVFLLALTSNPGADDFQLALTSRLGADEFQLGKTGEEPLYQRVVRTALEWADGLPGHLGFVTGATRPEYLAEVRALAPENFFLVPGVGAQGGDLEGVCAAGMSANGGLLVNASRSIIFASRGEDFAVAAAGEARKMQVATELQLELGGILGKKSISSR